jgi:hypothetical protein
VSFHSNDEQRLRELQEQIHRARTITPELMSDVIARVGPRLHVQHPTAKDKSCSPDRIRRVRRCRFEGVLHWNGAEILDWYLAAAKPAKTGFAA